MEEQIKQEEQGETGKIAKRFDNNINKLKSVFKGEEAFKKASIPNSEVGELVDELIKEEKDKLKASFKEKAANLLKKKVEFDKFIKQKEKEFQDAVTNKKKEFNKEMEDTFALLENIEKLKEDYLKSLTTEE